MYRFSSPQYGVQQFREPFSRPMKHTQERGQRMFTELRFSQKLRGAFAGCAAFCAAYLVYAHGRERVTSFS